jgi:channel protein (hemolysin III family)
MRVSPSLAVYAAGLMAMLGCSAVYNIAGHDPRRAFWRRLDHAAIMVAAGTYTPFAAIAIGGTWGAQACWSSSGQWPWQEWCSFPWAK